jgi:nucleotide-binding universal stress UspA family protein
MKSSEPHEPGPRGRVVVALHGRRAPLGAIGLGRLVAHALDAPLHGLFAWPSPIAAGEVPRLLRVTPELLEGMVLDVEVGSPGDRVLAAANAPSTAFVVVPSEPDEPDELGVGHVAHELLLGAAAGVVLVPPGRDTPRLERILLPLDGTQSTASCICPVGRLAQRARASMDIVFVGEAHAGRGHFEPGAMAPPLYVDQPQHEWAAFSNEFLHRFLKAVGHCPKGVTSRLFLGAGEPASEILRFSRELESDLVVLVWHGHLEDHHAGVFRAVVRDARCPVLVLKGGQ